MSGLPWSLADGLLLAPPVSWLAAGSYHLVSRNRHRIQGPGAATAQRAELVHRTLSELALSVSDSPAKQ